MTVRRYCWVLAAAAGLLGCSAALGQAPWDYTVRVSATVSSSPAQITLTWPADAQATGYTVSRKTRDATAWGAGAALAGTASSYVDAAVKAGDAYEYRVTKTASAGGTAYTGQGYIYAGIQAPLVDARGKVILVVDSTMSGSLAIELERLRQDLAGDGWTVLRHDVARTASPPSVKGLITADYNADPANVKAVFLFGHVPVPYSGNTAPDGHPDHVGAWPADVYYGDMDGTWTDSQVNTTSASDGRNWNVPGDGKFDPSTLPSDVELQVGRVDLANLPSFGQSETELLRQYLNKDHNFRFKAVQAQARGLVTDQFGMATGEPFAANGWGNFAALFGAANTSGGDWFGVLTNGSCLWGYACGPGSWASAAGVGTTAQFAGTDAQVVFTMLFGSYFGDWDQVDDFLRAPLATPTYGLTSAWAGRPNWMFHHMGLGETIGFCARLTQNNSGLYAGGNRTRGVHVALMGDPTLRLQAVGAAGNLVVTRNGAGGNDLRWSGSSDTVLGYHVYRAATMAGPFTRLTSSPVSGLVYSDAAGGSSVYMVRAVKLETSGSGTYYNASQGIFQSVDGLGSGAMAVVLQPTNNANFATPTNIQLVASTLDPAQVVTNVEFVANGVKVGQVSCAPYALSWTNAVAGSYTVVACAQSLQGLATNSAPVTIRCYGVAPRLTLTAGAGGAFVLTGIGMPGRSYQVQARDGQSGSWQPLGTVTADGSGNIRYVDSAPPGQRMYRTLAQ